MNLVVLTGHLGADPVLSYSTEGKAIAKMRLAVKSGEKTDWIGLVAFEKTAEFAANYLGKGSHIAVEGRISVNNYEKDGRKMTSTNVIAGRISFLDKKSDEGNA